MKTIYCAFFLFGLSCLCQASEDSDVAVFQKPTTSNHLECKQVCDQINYVDVKAGYFFFTSSIMSDVFDKGGADLQLSGAFSLCSWLRIYGSLEYLQKAGYSINGHQPTSIWEIPLSLGLQPFVSLYSSNVTYKKVSGYFSIGPRYFFAHVHNHSNYVDRSMNQNGLGGFVNLGLLFSYCRYFVVDVFGEYSYCKLHFHSSHHGSQGHSVQVGGLAFGGGLGTVF